MPERFLSRWARSSVLNLMILAAIGWTLRYKIILPLPAVHQKYLLHAHSHFAFAGWVSLGLMVMILWIISRYTRLDADRYKNILRLSQVSAWGMLLTFPFFGYALPSVFFSTLHVMMSYLFSWKAWHDIRRSGMPAGIMSWLTAALVFNVLSSAGTFFLAWLMSSGRHDQDLYVGAVYFYLHFQYNGWFLFALLGMAEQFLTPFRPVFSFIRDRWVFRLFLATAIPGLFLSMLWMRLPWIIQALTFLAAILSIASAILYVSRILQVNRSDLKQWPAAVRWLLGLALVALILKLIMQAMSVIPVVSPFAFGYRPIVIGYLHLVLLGFVSFALLGGLLHAGLLSYKKRTARIGIGIFITGVMLNEVLLMMQGIASIRYESVPGVPVLLFVMAGWIFSGVALLLIGQRWTNQDQYPG